MALEDATHVVMDTDAESAGAAACGGTAGLLMMAMSAVSFSMLSLFVHLLSTDPEVQMPSFELIAIRAFFGIWFVHD